MALYVECKPDETLARRLGVPGRKIIHPRNKSEVLKHLERRSGCTAMLDEDPVFNPRSYLDRMQVAEELGYWGFG